MRAPRDHRRPKIRSTHLAQFRSRLAMSLFRTDSALHFRSKIKLGQFRPLTRCVPSASSRGIVASSRCAGNLATRRPRGPAGSPSEWQIYREICPCGLPRAFQGLLTIRALRRRAWTEIPPHTTTRSAAQSLSVQWRYGPPLLSACSLLPRLCERASFCFSWVAEAGLGHRLSSELTHSVTPTRHVFLRLKIGT